MLDLDHAKELIESALPGTVASVFWDKTHNGRHVSAFIRERDGSRSSLLHTAETFKTVRDLADKIITLWDGTWLDDAQVKR